jgi:hypothetical protein
LIHTGCGRECSTFSNWRHFDFNHGQIAKETWASSGIAGGYLFRDYLELALKHFLFHSRWLGDQSRNEHWTQIKDVATTHSLRLPWDTIKAELVGKIPTVSGTATTASDMSCYCSIIWIGSPM